MTRTLTYLLFHSGQTSSGKTYTLNGTSLICLADLNEALLNHIGSSSDGDLENSEQRGLIPRILEYLFLEMERQESVGNVEFLCKCSYVEIYNESVFDLLDSFTPACYILFESILTLDYCLLLYF